MGCLFALLAALSSFTVVLMPCGNLSHAGDCGVDFFFCPPLLGEENQGGGGDGSGGVTSGVSHLVCTFECRLHVQVGHLWAFRR